MNYERGKIATKHSNELEGPFDGRRKGAISQVFNYDRKKSRAWVRTMILNAIAENSKNKEPNQE
jgi:hypothetical protein